MENVKFGIIFGVLTISLALLSQSTHAEIINVPDDFETIQAAIDESEDGDTVLVQPGMYVENIDFDGHNIVVGSLIITTGDTAYVDSTIIDGDSTDSVVQIGSGENEEAVLSGFTIRNGCAVLGGGIFIRSSSPALTHLIVHNNSSSRGSGIYIDRDANPIITSVMVRNNSAPSGGTFGGGIHCEDHCIPTINNCIIIGNSAEYGGGISILTGASPILTNVIVSENSCGDYGGGIYCGYAGTPTLSNVIVSENSTDCEGGDWGGGIYLYSSRIEMMDVTVSGNASLQGGGIYGYMNSEIIITNSNVIGNSAVANGGGIQMRSGSDLTMNHVCVSGNSAGYYGGGIYFEACYEGGADLDMASVTFVGNTTERDGGGLYLYYGARAVLVNGIFCNNNPQQIFAPRTREINTLTVLYSDIENGEDGIEDNHNVELIWGDGNIDADPLFVDPDEGNYHLTENSPCIDAGDPDSDPDPDNTRADMGAFYFPQDNPDPDIHVQPDSVAFPLTGVDSLAYAIITIRNFGGDTLDVSSQAILEEEDLFFIMEGGDAFQLEPQDIHETTILFEPMEEGDFEAVFRIECNDPDEEIVEIPITGSAVLMIPDIDVDADSLNFGNPNIDVIAEILVTISSVGNAPLMIFEQYIVPDEEYFYIRHGGGEVLLEPDSTHETVVAFAPYEYGDFEAMYVIESNDPDEEVIVIPLFGCVLNVACDKSELPDKFALNSVYPNPFNSSTTITYQLPHPSNVSLTICNPYGRKVGTLVNERLDCGIYNATWQPDNLASGLYLIRLEVPGQVLYSKLMLIK